MEVGTQFARSIDRDPEPTPEWAAVSVGVLDACRDAVVLTDLDARVVHANRAARELFGDELQAGASVIGEGVLSQRVADRQRFEGALRDAYVQPDERASGEITHVGNRARAYEWVSEPIREDEGVVGRSIVLHDCSHERELATLKGDFLSTVTHELRTPLTSVKGSLQLVLGKSAGLSAIDRELLTISLKNADRLIRLINDLLDISRLELGRTDLAFDTIAIDSVLEEAVEGLRSYAATRDIGISYEADRDLPAVAGDRDRLIQVLTNLVSNAVKFSPAGERVAVRATTAKKEIHIAVRDWGPGISVQDRARLFQRFQRLHPGRSDEPGAGLGLAISKAIVERHGGRITVESREDHGSTFTVRLPLSAETGSSASGRTRHDEQPTILLVDAEGDLATIVEASLRGVYRASRVKRGVQALRAARTERPAAILLDATLPDLGSLDVLRILHHTPATRAIPVVLFGPASDHEAARALGAAAVVPRSIGAAALRAAIEGVLLRRTSVDRSAVPAFAAD